MNEIAVVLQNTRAVAVTLCLEPWGECYTLAPSAVVRVDANGPVGGQLEILHGDDTLTVYAWSGSTVTLTDDKGRALGPDARPRVP